MTRLRSAFLVLVLLLAGCAGSGSQAPPPTLYQQLGGEAGIRAIVEDFAYRVADDPQLVGFFANTNIDHLVASLEQQFCAVSDGPCVYQGPPMDKVHQYMGIRETDFNRLVGKLQAALLAQGVPAAARNQLLKRLAAMHDDVMRRQDG